MKFDKYMFYILAIYLLFVLVISPIHEFPLHDDWVYAEAVNSLIEGKLWISPIVAPNLLFTIFYGFIFAKIFSFFGFFSALRLSSLVLGFFGLIFLYMLLEKLGLEKKKSFLISLLLFFNPIYFILSFTFMTDVPFLAMLIIACYFYVRYFKDNFDWGLIFGTLFSVLAFSIRQNGLLILFGVLAYSFFAKKNFKKVLVYSVFGFLLMFFLILWKNSFAAGSVEYMKGFITDDFMLMLKSGVNYMFFIFMYFGLFLFPLIFVNLIKWKEIFKQKFLLLISSLYIVSFVVLFKIKYLDIMPYLGFVFTKTGLGQHLVVEGEKALIFPESVWWVITLISLIGGIYLIYKTLEIIYNLFINFNKKVFLFLIFTLSLFFVFNLVNNYFYFSLRLSFLILSIVFILFFGYLYKNKQDNEDIKFGIKHLIYSIALFQFGFLFIFGNFDRYMLPLFLFFAVLLISDFGKVKFEKLFALLLMPIVMFSTFGTLEYFSWNNARWELCNGIVKDGVDIKKIDCGTEWVGWFLHKYSLENPDENRYIKGEPLRIKLISPVVDPEYMISFSNLKGYEIFKEKEFFSIFYNKGENKIYLLKRVEK